MTDHAKFFVLLGQRVRELRKARGFTQEDMIAHGFSARHWQMIEAGRPITLHTLLRISEVLGVNPEELLAGISRVSGV
jgi:transcriptional regulator with XRE-family HTH domain